MKKIESAKEILMRNGSCSGMSCGDCPAYDGHDCGTAVLARGIKGEYLEIKQEWFREWLAKESVTGEPS